MCGIFGLIQKENNTNTGKVFRDLFLLSESRGKEAAGFALRNPENIRVYKTPFPARVLVKSKVFKNEIEFYQAHIHHPFIGIGHSRLVTNGYEQYDSNNQPVVKNGIVAIHNGIIVNQSALWKSYDRASRISDLDSELIPTIIDSQLNFGQGMGEAIGTLFKEIVGMANIAMLFNRYRNLILATNNGSIYYLNDLRNEFFVFASERYFIEQILKKHKTDLSEDSIQQLNPGYFVSVNLNLLTFQKAKVGEHLSNLEESKQKSEVKILKDETPSENIMINTSLEHSVSEVSPIFIDEYEKRSAAIDNLKRCTRCVLLETFPYIEFDKYGVCNYCNNYHQIKHQGKKALEVIANDCRRKDGKPECLIPFSGGRDSSYALHYVVKELGLKPIAYSYDWGMLTDLARRNQARMCGKLGVEHILISADIRKKRENIRKNVQAWLRRPDLGTVPLFMAGDKQYFYYANLLMKQNDLRLSILGENLLETTNFKSGFCGIKPNFQKGSTYYLSLTNKFKLIAHYGKQYILNPAYLNSSLLDTIGAFKSYYVIQHRNLNIYNYIKWDEKIITDILLKEYDWETDPGTKTIWRIGDGTAAFYNYIYYMVAGFTENDTFRSNQIREGDLSKKDALELVKKENQPRWDSIQWYCRTIGIDFIHVINKVNKIISLFKQ